MPQKKSAAFPSPREAAKKPISDTRIIHPTEGRRQFLRDSFGRFLTAVIASAELVGHDRIVDDLLQFKSQWIRGGRA